MGPAFPMTLLEVCVDSVPSALAAVAGGARRLEYCAQLELDGLTPVESELREVVAAVSVPVFAMVRPRAGSFVMTTAELGQMEREISMVRKAGAAGVVLGVMTDAGTIDRAALACLVAVAFPLPVTFHRAFDGIANPLEALEQLIAVGVTRLLTSGDGASAWEGRALLAQLVALAGDRLVVMPGGGVRQDHVLDLIEGTGAREVHSSQVLHVPG